ncbi:hypothetical protein AVEN_270069-1 [Araneus ventricosus]|uniref:Uncharacterized protein n=1 Tax=Araneus ventricosus TaxID=182803 RepID=A0A4Y2MUY3_ARAVE|nr:hypothetical protein AVEN_270069-1 [Araneus ventricosus]
MINKSRTTSDKGNQLKRLQLRSGKTAVISTTTEACTSPMRGGFTLLAFSLGLGLDLLKGPDFPQGQPRQLMARLSHRANEGPLTARPSHRANEGPLTTRPSHRANEVPLTARPSHMTNEGPFTARPSQRANEGPLTTHIQKK